MTYYNKFIAFLVFVSLLFTGCGFEETARVPVQPTHVVPATVAEAVQVLDLMTFPAMTIASESINRRVNSLSYAMAPDVEFKKILQFQRNAFNERMWTELPGSTVSNSSAKCTFTRNGFFASSTIQRGKGFNWGVSITLHGNVDVRALVPASLTPRKFQASPQWSVYVTEVNAVETSEECRKRFEEQGWEPFGMVGTDPTVYNVLFFRQNAILLNTTICPEWAKDQKGKTRVEVSTKLLPVEFPVPKETMQLRYVDAPTTELAFESKQSQEDLVRFYLSALGSSGWKAKTNVPVEVDSRFEIAFRNPAGDMLTVRMSCTNPDQVLTVTISHQTSMEIRQTP